VFGAFKYNLLPVTFCFFCHFLILFLIIQNVTFFLCLFQNCGKSVFIYKTYT
jgi:hypothetical protein